MFNFYLFSKYTYYIFRLLLRIEYNLKYTAQYTKKGLYDIVEAIEYPRRILTTPFLANRVRKVGLCPTSACSNVSSYFGFIQYTHTPIFHSQKTLNTPSLIILGVLFSIL